MNSPGNINTSSSKSTSQIINNIHNMPWLKRYSSSQNVNDRQMTDKDGKILGVKKTDEDYFSGTREEKKTRKRREKKGKSVLSLNSLEELIILTNKNVTPVVDFEETKKTAPNFSPPQEDEKFASNTNFTQANTTVWSTNASTANKLFPNVQSLVINRIVEEEMVTKAIAESIATVQLEQFKRLIPEKENRWDALHGADEDEDSWDNVQRNLPSELEGLNLGNNVSYRKNSSDDDNNSSGRSTPGILKNKEKNVNRLFMEPETLDFCFTRCSESSKEKINETRSLKSVSFDESIAVKFRSSESSKNDESGKTLLNNDEKKPSIDKYGRVDGYSERRLFMGKGARIREQEYIQTKCSLGSSDTRSQNLESNSQARPIVKTQKRAITNSQYFINSKSHEPISNIREPKTEKITTIKNSHGTRNTSKKIENVEDTVVKLNETVVKSPSDEPSLSSSQNSTFDDSTESYCEHTSTTKFELQAPVITQLKQIESKTEALEAVKNIQTPHYTDGNALNLIHSRVEEINHHKTELVSSATQTIDPNELKIPSTLDEMDNPPQRKEVIGQETTDMQYSERNIRNQDIISKDSSIVLTISDDNTGMQILTKDIDPDSHCLVPTLIKDNECLPKIPLISILYTDSVAAMPMDVGFQSPAHQNLLVAGAAYLDASSNDNITQQVQFYQNNSANELPNYKNYSVLSNDVNIGTKQVIDQAEYAYSMHQFGIQNLSYRSDSLPVNPFCNPYNGMESGKNVLSNTCTDYSGLIATQNKLPFHVRTDNGEKRFLTLQAPPGLMKNLQLPPGFTKKENSDKDNQPLKLPMVTQTVDNNKPKKPKVYTKESVQPSASNYIKTTPKYPVQREPTRCDKSWTASTARTSPNPQKKQRNCNTSQARFERQNSNTTENGKVLYPISEITKNSRDKYRGFNPNEKRDKLNPSHSSKIRRDTVNKQSSGMSKSVVDTFCDNTGKNSMGPSSNNNHLMQQRPNTISDSKHQGMNNDLQNSSVMSQSAMSGIYQYLDRQSRDSRNVNNWQYIRNFINPMPVPMNLVPNYQIPQTPNLPVNVLPDPFKVPIYPCPGSQQYPAHMLNSPAYSMLYLSNAEGNDTENMHYEDYASPEMNSMLNNGHFVEMADRDVLPSGMEHPILKARNYLDYNVNQNSMGQFVPNVHGYSDYYETETVPNTQNSCNLKNNQTNETMTEILSNDRRGRGRGRLIRKRVDVN